MAVWWLEIHVEDNNRQEAPTKELPEELNCLKGLHLFQTMCKVLSIPMQAKKIFANMTVRLYEHAKKRMTKHSRVYSSFQLDIGPVVFKRAFVSRRNAVTTAVKRTFKTNDCDGRGREDLLKENLERNVTLCLHKSFCRNRETAVVPLSCCKQRVEEQRC